MILLKALLWLGFKAEIDLYKFDVSFKEDSTEASIYINKGYWEGKGNVIEVVRFFK